MNNLPIEEALIVNIDEKKFIRQDNNDIELIDPTTYLQLRQSLKTVYGKKGFLFFSSFLFFSFLFFSFLFFSFLFFSFLFFYLLFMIYDLIIENKIK